MCEGLSCLVHYVKRTFSCAVFSLVLVARGVHALCPRDTGCLHCTQWGRMTVEDKKIYNTKAAQDIAVYKVSASSFSCSLCLHLSAHGVALDIVMALGCFERRFRSDCWVPVEALRQWGHSAEVDPQSDMWTAGLSVEIRTVLACWNMGITNMVFSMALMTDSMCVTCKSIHTTWRYNVCQHNLHAN